MQTAEGRVDAFKAILPSVQLVQDRVERSAITQEIAEYLKLDPAVIGEQLRPAARKQGGTQHAAATSTVPPNEVLLLTCFVLSPEARISIQKHILEQPVSISPEARAILETASGMEKEGLPFSLDVLTARLEPRLQRLVAQLTFGELGVAAENAPDLALHHLRALAIKGEQVRQNALKEEIRRLEQKGDLTEAIRLTAELDRLRQTSSEL